MSQASEKIKNKTCRWCGQEVLWYSIQKHLIEKCRMAPQPNPDQRFCSHCMALFAVDDFSRNIRRISGRDSNCKQCSKDRLQRWTEEAKRGKKDGRKIIRRPRAWKLKTCRWCKEEFCARDVYLHEPRCPERPADLGCSKNLRPIEILGKVAVMMKEEAHSTEYQRRKRREHHATYFYKIGLEEYRRMEKEQDGKCAICGQTGEKIGKKSRTLHIDHDHVTGQLRSLLCHTCNVGLGHFHDNPALLLKALTYLAKYGKIGTVS